jgi:heme a synthase
MHKSNTSRAVAIWLLIGVAMLLIQIVLGGITRLTGSGLSITEWNLVTGVLPPVKASAWAAEFDKYRQTPQFKLLHADFSLSDFKFIFFWEWFHRFWARLVGVVFIIGFIYLICKQELTKQMIKPLLILFLLGGLQGAVGWIMVKSGLVGDAIYVQPAKLAMHFIFALGLIVYTFWFALGLLIPQKEMLISPGLNKGTWTILLVLLVQLVFGALMAGHKAANSAPTWPTINGEWIPASLTRESPLLFNFIDNKITIHFVHRGLAYLLLALVIGWTVRAGKIKGIVSPYFSKVRWIPMGFILLQIIAGILTVINGSAIVAGHWGFFETMASFHQFIALLFLLTMVFLKFVVRSNGKIPGN